MMRRRLRTIAVGTTLVLGGCGSAAVISPSPAVSTASSSSRPSSTAKLSITTPATGDVFPAGDITLKVQLTGARIVAVTSTTLAPSRGHLHIVLDNQLVSMTSGTTTTLPGVGPGTHLLKVEFVASDHAPFDPRVIAATSFTVKG